MYGQIILFLFGLLVLYYAVMIFLDIQKAKAEKAAQLEKNKEEIIDISDEAGQFQPVIISRDETKKPKPIETSENKEEEEPQKEEEKQEKDSKDKSSESHEEENERKEEPKKVYIHNPDAMPMPKPLVTEEKAEPSPTPQKTFRSPNYRGTTMTDAYDVDSILQHVNQVAETGQGLLGDVIYSCRNAE